MSESQKTLHMEEAAKILGVSRATAYRAASRGEIPAIRVGKRVLVLREPLERLLNGVSPHGQKDPVAASL